MTPVILSPGLITQGRFANLTSGSAAMLLAASISNAGRLVTAEAKNTLQPQSTDAVLLVGDIPHCHEPHSQRLSGVLKDRPSRQRRLRCESIPVDPDH